MKGRPVLDINAGECIEDGCTAKPRCRGMCSRHYRRWHYENHERERRGHTVARRPRVGEIRINSGGYVEQKIGPGGRDWKLQHRLVMEQMIGRELLPTENVHHINGAKTDNRPSNLELWVTAQPKGQRVEDLLEYANYIIDNYGGSSAAKRKSHR